MMPIDTMLMYALSGTMIVRPQNSQASPMSSAHPATTVRSSCRGLRLNPRIVLPATA